MAFRDDIGRPARAGVTIGLRLFAVAMLGAIASCAPTPRLTPPPVPEIAREARIVVTARPLECVAYARDRTGIAIRGDAWTWWNQAQGRYRRGRVPEPDAVMVFRRSGRSLGHLAVVTRVASDRVVVVDHANWLNGGRIHRATPVMDVSPMGDWSQVRVWHIPTGQWGITTYSLYGFVYPEGLTAGRQTAK